MTEIDDQVQPEPEGETITAEQLLMGTEQPADDVETAEAEMLAMLEAIVYITDEPLSAKQIAVPCTAPRQDQAAAGPTRRRIRQAEHGLTVGNRRRLQDGHQGRASRSGTCVRQEAHAAVEAVASALETLAVIAYKQPMTTPEIMDIRGVQGAGVLKTLLDRKLIAEAGRKNVVGKPILYKTTKEFLVQFGLKDLNELPTLKEFEELRRLAFSDATMDSPEPSAEPEHEPADLAEPELQPQPKTNE